MPMRVSPLRTTCTRLAGRRAVDGLAAGRGAEARGTDSVVPARILLRLRSSLRAARAPTVVRCRAAMPMSVSPGFTRYVVQPWGAGLAAVVTDAGEAATSGAVAGGAEITMVRPPWAGGSGVTRVN